MAAEDIGSLVVRIEANLRNFEDGVNKMNNKISGFGDTVKKIGKVIAGAFVVKEIGAFFKSTIEDAAEAEANLAQLDNVLKSTGGAAGVTAEQVTNFASELQKVTKFSDDQTISGQNLLLTFTKIGKDVFPQATETMLDMSQALGQDVKSSAIQLGKALNDPVNGVTALRRVGVSFTEEQQNMINKMVESGNIMGAQKLILKELQTEFGGSARAAGETFAGKLERLKNQFGEIKESIGGALLPVLSNLSEWFIGKMPEIQNFVTTAFDNIKNVIQPIYETVMPLLQQGFQYFYENILPLFSQKIGEASSTVLPLIMDALKNLAETILPPLQRIFEVFINDVLPKLADAYMYWVKNVYPIIVDAFNYIVDNVLPPLIEIIEFIATEIVPMLAEKFQEWMPKIVEIVKKLWEGIKMYIDLLLKLFQFVWPTIKDVVKIAVDIISGVIGGLLKVLSGVIDFLTGVFTGDWEKAWNGIKEIFSGVWDIIGTVLKGAINLIIAAINTLIRGLNKISIKVPDWVATLTGLAKGSKFGFDIKEIPLLAKGTNFVPFDTMAFLHKGEAVVPAENNPSNPSASNPVGGDIFNFAEMFKGANFYIRSDSDIKMLAREFYNLTASKNRGSGVIPAT